MWFKLLHIQFAGFQIEVCSELAKLPLGLYVFGAVGNVATLIGALAEGVRVQVHMG